MGKKIEIEKKKNRKKKVVKKIKGKKVQHDH